MFRGRRAATIENDHLRLTTVIEGGHIAEILDKRSGVSPLWMPEWPTIEPSQFGETHRAVYGAGAEGKLLAGIMGHNICLDIFGPPSDDEAAAGLTAHGEAAVVAYDANAAATTLSLRADLPLAGLRFERRLSLVGPSVHVHERVENLGAYDRPIGWTQHVTLGAPFLEKGVTEFECSATRSKVFETAFGTADYLAPGATFDWPVAPRLDGQTENLKRFTAADSSNAYTAHLMDPAREHAFFVAFSPRSKLAFGYVWRQRDFPWMGIWEENHSRPQSPWNGTALTRGMEFGVSPFPETRQTMIDRGTLFGVPTYRWLRARGSLKAEYWIVVQASDRVPESLSWPQG
jgi:hypothetical protein